MVDIHFFFTTGSFLAMPPMEDVVVFNATLQQNLSIARPKASSEEMKEVKGAQIKMPSVNQLGTD